MPASQSDGAPGQTGALAMHRPQTAAEASSWLADNRVRYVLAQFVDIHGTAKAKSVPAEHLNMVLEDGAGFAGFALWGFGMGPNGPDYMARGDLSTLSLMPWQPGYARLACDGYVNGRPYEYCSRVALKRMLASLSDRGLTLNVGMEPEFFLLSRSDTGNNPGPAGVSIAQATDTLDKPCYDYKGLSRQRLFVERLVESLRPIGLDIYQIDHEDANGQFEINFTYADALKTADDFVMFKMAAGEIAHELGMTASFMAKPFSNRTGSGAHFHLSMASEASRNLFHDEGDRHGLGLSQTAYHFAAGLLAHAKGLAAVCCPTVNSYKRLVVGRALSGATWAPAYISYGDNNRTSMVRVPHGRLELRLPDSSCNPYLALCAVIAAGMDGVNRQLQPGTPNNDNLYDYSPALLAERGIEVLPQSLSAALDAFEADPVLVAGLGENLAREFVSLKRMEWVEYSRHVSDWEVRRYLEFF
jgi:glutamine synthetase